MEFKHFIFQAWKVMKFNSRSLKLWKIKVAVNGKAKTMQDKEKWTPEFVSVELFKV